MLDVRRMQVLRAVVSSGSVTAAATNLGYTPSAISQQVAALEKEAGMALLERVGRGVRPTAAGRLLTEHAAVIGKHVAEAETALANLRSGQTGQLVIRYFATAGAALVPPALARLREKHPGVRVDLKLVDPYDPLPEVEQGRADLAIVVGPPQRARDGVRLVHLLDDRYRAVVPRQHRLAAKRVLDLTDLVDEPLIGSEPPGPCLDSVLNACAAAGFTPNFTVESDDYATAQGFVAAGLGISLVPLMGLSSRHPDVVVRRIRNPEPSRPIYAAIREISLAQPALRSLLAGLRDAASRGLPRPSAKKRGRCHRARRQRPRRARCQGPAPVVAARSRESADRLAPRVLPIRTRWWSQCVDTTAAELSVLYPLPPGVSSAARTCRRAARRRGRR